ncbi:MAG: PEGA domain-containing protein [Candidatus Zixiibacteriota bacterium]|nr:MAG: PEGA domain-containing protein [candidate division Zixibacteria bacterium]
MKTFYLTLVSIILMSPAVFPQQADSPGIIRVKVDLDSVTLQINSETIENDSYGNALIPDAWFIINLPQGDYEFVFQREGYIQIDTNIAILPGEVYTFDVRFLVVEEDTTEILSGNATLDLTSDPENVSVIVEMIPDTVIAPSTINIKAGDHSFRALADGFEELSHEMAIDADNTISLKFILAFSRPAGLTAEDLELEYKPLIPLRDEMEATNQKNMFNNLTETFALIPLGQGILARLLLGDETEAGANILIAVGAGLTAGSYILGQIIPRRKLAKIREFNEEANRINSEANYHNKEIDRELERNNSELLENWMLNNQNRGTVEVTIE